MKPVRANILPARSPKLRIEATPLLMLALMVLVAIVRPFTGTAILLHDACGLGSDTHVAHMVAFVGVSGSAACHGGEHGDHKLPPCEDGACSLEGTDGTVISLLAQPQLPPRHSPAPTDNLVKSRISLAAWLLVQPPHSQTRPVAPGGCPIHGPRHLCAMTACDRLLSTSRAILI